MPVWNQCMEEEASFIICPTDRHYPRKLIGSTIIVHASTAKVGWTTCCPHAAHRCYCKLTPSEYKHRCVCVCRPLVESRAAGAAARCALLQCPPVLAKKIPNVDKKFY